MSLSLLGRCGFEDSMIPVKGKSEWGMDTLTRKLKGHRSLLPDYVAALKQGDRFQDYYLQTWEPDDETVIATLTMVYKGFQPGGTPEPVPQTEIMPAVGSISKSYALENSGLGRAYRRQGIYKIELGQYASPGEAGEIIADKPIFATGVTMEFTYDAIQTVWRYIRTGKPERPRFYAVEWPRVPTVKRARYTTSDGSVFGINAPASITADLSPQVLNRVISSVGVPVFGTPYYECQDVVRRELGEGDADTEGSFGE